MKKRIFSLILMLTMLVGVLPAKAARGIPYVWVEAEEAGTVVSGEFRMASVGKASAGGLMKVDSQNEEPHELSVKFSISNEDEYDIFMIATPGATDWCSTRK